MKVKLTIGTILMGHSFCYQINNKIQAHFLDGFLLQYKNNNHNGNHTSFYFG